MKRALALAGLVACSAAPAEPAGVGSWDVTRTHKKDATGRCEPTDLPDGRKGTWCYLQPPLKLGDQSAQVDLYFGGTGDDAPLVEEQLKIAACDLDKLDTWGRTSFGAPMGHGDAGTFWKNRYALVALVPVGSQCLVRVLPLSEQAEFDRISGITAGAGARGR